MNVFIDVFNNLLKYNEQEVFIVVDKYPLNPYSDFNH